MRTLLRLLILLLLAAPAHAAGTLTVGIPLEPPNLDPTVGSAAAVDEVVYANVMEGLTRIGADGAVRPGLATRWEASPDGLHYTFHLRSGVRFHDGRALDAAVVRFSLDRARAPGSGNAIGPQLAAIAAIDTPGPLTIRLRLSRPAAMLPTWLGWGDAVIVHPASVALLATAPVGTGPFRVAGWARGTSVTLERWAGYWGGAAALDRVAFRIIPDAAAASAALRSGDVDAFPNFPAADQLAELRRDRRFRVVVGSTEGETILALNNRIAPFADLRVRRAIAHAIDRRALIAGAMDGFGVAIGSHYPPGGPGFVDLTGRYRYDPAEARRLLAAAGYRDGFRTTLKLPPIGYARRGGEVIQAQLAAVGIRVEIENVEWAPWLDQVLARHDFAMTIVSHTEPADYDIYARPDYYFGYDSRPFRALIARLEGERDPARRNAILGDIQRRLADDSPNVFLFMLPKLGVWRTGVTGLWTNAPIQANDMTGVSITGDARAPDAAAAAAVPGWLPWLAVPFVVVAVLLARRMSPLWLAGRLGALGLTLAAAAIVVFVALSLAPGDPVAAMLGLNPDPAALARLRAELGVDQPAVVRFVRWAGGLIGGDLGQSLTYRVPVARLVAERAAVSLPLALIAMALAVLVAVPLALAAAARRGRATDVAVSAITQLGVAIPNFWAGALLVLGFAVARPWFPAGGFPGWGDPGQALRHLALPALALALPQAAVLARVLRAALVEQFDEDWFRTARAKGLSVWAATTRHALPNAAVPALTILGLQFAFLIAGAVIVENVFALPGLGRLLFQAVAGRDFVTVQSVVVLLVAGVVCIGFLVDLAIAALDPRIGARA